MRTMSEHSSTQTIMGLSFTTLFIALGLFVASLFFPVFFTEDNTILGYWVLVTGWIGFISFQFAWYANTFALFALYYSRHKPLFAFLIAISSILIASQAYLFTEVPYNEKTTVTDYGSGFYTWYFSFYFLAASILLRIVARSMHKSEREEAQLIPVTADNGTEGKLPAIVTQHCIVDEIEVKDKNTSDLEKEEALVSAVTQSVDELTVMEDKEKVDKEELTTTAIENKMTSLV